MSGVQPSELAPRVAGRSDGPSHLFVMRQRAICGVAGLRLRATRGAAFGVARSTLLVLVCAPLRVGPTGPLRVNHGLVGSLHLDILRPSALRSFIDREPTFANVRARVNEKFAVAA